MLPRSGAFLERRVSRLLGLERSLKLRRPCLSPILQTRFARNKPIATPTELQKLGLYKIPPSKENAVTLKEAVKLVCRLSPRFFDETIELNLNMNLDSRKADHHMRGNVYLPNGIGKTTRVCVFVNPAKVEEAKQAGADIIGDAALIAEIKSGNIEFDRCIATPDQMKLLAPVARYLGPKGLMPNPKMGTLTINFVEAIKSAKTGQVPIKLSKEAAINGPVGKVSMGEDKVYENACAFIEQLRDDLRPKGAKARFILGAYLASSYGRGIKVLIEKQPPWRREKFVFKTANY